MWYRILTSNSRNYMVCDLVCDLVCKLYLARKNLEINPETGDDSVSPDDANRSSISDGRNVIYLLSAKPITFGKCDGILDCVFNIPSSIIVRDSYDQ